MRKVNTLAILLLVALHLFSQTDGPATLPQRTPLTSINSPNPPKTVGSADDLQAAINAAVAGDTLLVDPLNTHVGSLVLPNLEPCDPNNGITIKRDGVPLAEDQYSHSVLTGQQMPKIILKGTQSITGGHCVAFSGFEIARVSGGTMYNLVQPGAGAHDIIYDHIYCHGTTTDETVRCFALYGGVKNVTIRNSRITDFHCKALGTCSDAQGIAYGINDAADSGNYLFQNNYIEASGENIMGGGGGDQFTPCDITATHNELVKPSSWMPGSPDYAGIPWIVKNLFEIKNACRVLVEGNTMRGSWGGYTQLGWGILISVKNQSNNCPLCTVLDVTVRNNRVSHSGQAMQIMFVYDTGFGYAKEQGRISVHDNVFDDLQYDGCYACGQWMFQVSSAPDAPIPMHDVSIVNNTVYLTQWQRQGGFLMMGGSPTNPMPNIVFSNNVVPAGMYPIYSTGGTALTNCIAPGTLDYAGAVAKCWSGASALTGNVVLGQGPAKAIWPAGNSVVSSGANVSNVQKALLAQ